MQASLTRRPPHTPPLSLAAPLSPTTQVEVVGVPEELKRVAYAALTTRPNFAYTLREVEGDLRRVFATGWFSSVVPDAEDTRDGVKLLVKVRRGLAGGGARAAAPPRRRNARAQHLLV